MAEAQTGQGVTQAWFSLSNTPVVHAEPGNFPKVRQILGEKEGIMSYYDARDFQIHRSDAQLGPSESLKLDCGIFIEVEDRAQREIIQERMEAGISLDLLSGGFGSGDVGEPAAHLLLKTNNRYDNLVICASSLSTRLP